MQWRGMARLCIHRNKTGNAAAPQLSERAAKKAKKIDLNRSSLKRTLPARCRPWWSCTHCTPAPQSNPAHPPVVFPKRTQSTSERWIVVEHQLVRGDRARGMFKWPGWQRWERDGVDVEFEQGNQCPDPSRGGMSFLCAVSRLRLREMYWRDGKG